MSRLFGHFIPAFLKRLDHKLLLNYPIVWASRIHYVLFFGLGVFGFMLFKLLIMPIEPADIPEMGNLFLISSIPFVLVLLLWMWSAKTFRTEKGYGESSSKDQLQEVVLIMAGVVMLALSPVFYVSSYEQKVKQVISQEQFLEDLRILNEGAIYFTKSYFSEEKKRHNDYSPDLDQALIGYKIVPDKQKLPTWSDVKKLQARDSETQKLTRANAFMQVYEKYMGEELIIADLERGVLSEFDLRFLQNPEKYMSNLDISELNALHQPLWHVGNILYSQHTFHEVSFTTTYGFIILFLSLAFSLFLVVKWKYFWLSLVVSIVGILFITWVASFLTALAYLFKSTPDSGYYFTGILYLAVLGAALITGLTAKKFRFLSIFSLSLATLLTIFLPSHIWTLIQSIFGSLGVHPAMGSVYSWTMGSLLLGAVVSVWLWLHVYKPHLIRIQSQPGK